MKREITVSKDVDIFPCPGGKYPHQGRRKSPRSKEVIVIKDEDILCEREEYLR